MRGWAELQRRANDAASTVGLCFNQRFGLTKVAEYMRQDQKDGSDPRLGVIMSFHAGAKASVSKRSSESIRRALEWVIEGRAAPETLTGLRWFEQPKLVTEGADRLVALWIALEALMAGEKGP